MNFEHYYDEHWLSRSDYFLHHRERFLQTWACLEDGFLSRVGTVLDVGGVGPVAEYLSTLGWQVAQSTQDLRGPLALQTGSFDLILCTETIEHIKDQDSDRITDLEKFNYSGVRNMLDELARAMCDDGHLLITTPNACSLHTLSKWLHGELLLMDPSHVREFTLAELERVAQGSSLVAVYSRVVNSWSADPLLDAEFIRKLTSLSPGFEAISHGDNIIAVFRKAPGQ